MKIGPSWQVAEAFCAMLVGLGFLLAHVWSESPPRQRIPKTSFRRIRLIRLRRSLDPGDSGKP